MNPASKKRLVIALTALTGLSACAPVDSRRFEPGAASEEQVRTALGPPLHELRTSQPEHQSRQWIYPDQVSFQLEAGRLTARNRPPEGSERNLQYWRARWRGRLQFSEAASAPDAHGVSLKLLSCPEEHTLVFYSPNDGRVVQVTEYAPR